MSSKIVERAVPRPAGVQVRSSSADAQTVGFTGYASTFDQPYHVADWLGEYQETIKRGAFTKTLREQAQPGGRGVPLLVNHDPSQLLANTKSGTSRLSEDSRGLLNEADLDTRQQLANDLVVSMHRGDIDQMSFSFGTVCDEWYSGDTQRNVLEARLYDTSVVLMPANPATTAELQDAMRSAMGREGRSLWLADQEPSVRSALPALMQGRQLGLDGDDLLDRALRALQAADGLVSARSGQPRARTARLADSLLALRQGKVLSASNVKLLGAAMVALSDAQDHHSALGDAHQQASSAIQKVLDNATGDGASSGDGTSNSTPPGNGNPIMPQDGAGPRSAQQLAAERKAEIVALVGGPRAYSERLRRQREAEIKALRRAA